MASKSVELFKNMTDRRQTERPRYKKLCRNGRNRLRCRKRLRL